MQTDLQNHVRKYSSAADKILLPTEHTFVFIAKLIQKLDCVTLH
jgi:hypothetical protein